MFLASNRNGNKDRHRKCSSNSHSSSSSSSSKLPKDQQLSVSVSRLVCKSSSRNLGLWGGVPHIYMLQYDAFSVSYNIVD